MIEKTKYCAEIWLDLLCWESFVKVLYVHREEPKKIYYCQVSVLFIPFLRLMQLLTKIEMVQILDFIFSHERLGGRSAYEAVHIRLKALLKKVGENWAKKTSIIEYANRNGFNVVKITEHLKESAFYYLHRPLEIMVMAEIRSKGQAHFIVLKRTFFSEILKNENKSQTVLFYDSYISHLLPILKRSAYYYDNRVAYYQSKYRLLWPSLSRWIRVAASLLTAKIRIINRAALADKERANVFVEILQSRIRTSEINDIFWFENSCVSPESVYTCETREVDNESRKLLASLGLKYFRLFPPLIFNNLLVKEKSTKKHIYVIPSFYFILKTTKLIMQILKNSFILSEDNWLNLQLANYKFRVLYWQNIYKQLNIKIVWSMADSDYDKLAKAQALELLDGIYAGSHWSNYPFVSGFNQKCYDVFFVWGDHFKKNIFNEYPYLDVFEVGYVSDHYFFDQSIRAAALRNRYIGEFIISYQDNMMTNDIQYSLDMQLKIHEMLLGLLQRNKNIILFLKPKRKRHFDEVLKNLPLLDEFIKKGRIEVFFGETIYTKAVPAMIGMASDLVVGLGISTAAAECYFAGTVAFHVDLTGFMTNEFANKGLNKIVFRDIENLGKAVQAQIDGQGISHKDCFKYYDMLDTFQDGKAYLRTGFVIRKLQEALQAGLSREAAVKLAREAYDTYIKENYGPVKNYSPEGIGVAR